MKIDFKLPKASKRQWLKALRSGEYKQGVGALKSMAGDTGEQQFCCLGVARDAGLCTRKKPSDKTDSCQDEYVTTTFLPMNVQKFLANKNDGDGGDRWSFSKIANWIERNL